jgi:hypothetical protein
MLFKSSACRLSTGANKRAILGLIGAVFPITLSDRHLIIKLYAGKTHWQETEKIKSF